MECEDNTSRILKRSNEHYLVLFLLLTNECFDSMRTDAPCHNSHNVQHILEVDLFLEMQVYDDVVCKFEKTTNNRKYKKIGSLLRYSISLFFVIDLSTANKHG